ncbi:U32 family peptidase [Ferrimonas pelagia]|uniref:U32 family peptidase n=1 Tax=Ferrimonas pelagia TaxID=1177826 RepID=A0ABP9EIL8_9GAMM
MIPTPMKLSLAPNWWPADRNAQQQWLEHAGASPAQRLYLGESVCALRDRMAPRTLLALAETLNSMGKQVILSSLSLVASDKDLALLNSLGQQDQFAIEANDMAAVALAHERGLPFVAGSGLNIYNLEGIRWLLSLGMIGYQPPLEMAAETLSILMAQCEQAGLRQQFELELMAYGSPPLAVSARCASARVAGRNRQRCEKSCQHTGAQLASTLEGQPILRLNGVQIHGHAPIDLLGDLNALRQLGIDWLRLDLGPAPDWDWLPTLQQALQESHPGVTAPQPGIQHFWQRQAGDVALFGD